MEPVVPYRFSGTTVPGAAIVPPSLGCATPVARTVIGSDPPAHETVTTASETPERELRPVDIDQRCGG